MPTVTERKREPAEPGRRRGRYPKEFRRDAAALVITSIGPSPTLLGSSEWSSRRWVTGCDRNASTGASTRGRRPRCAGERQAAPGGEAPDHGARPAQTKCGLLGEGAGSVSRYRFVSAMKAEGFPIDAACEAAEVSPSAYYDDWAARSAGPTEAEWDEAVLVNEMFEIHHGLDDTYGSPRMGEVALDHDLVGALPSWVARLGEPVVVHGPRCRGGVDGHGQVVGAHERRIVVHHASIPMCPGVLTGSP